MDDRFERFIRNTFRSAGRQYARARRAYDEGREAESDFGLPRDDEGRARIVCRRYAERRSVTVDAEGRPECFEQGHPDCEGCAEDVRSGVVETW
jgi:hypothetical protein